jgi:hypothetical protein
MCTGGASKNGLRAQVKYADAAETAIAAMEAHLAKRSGL